VCAASSQKLGAQPPKLEPVPDPPSIPERVQSGETLEPEVTIIRRARETVTEYRVDGQLQAIKVEPENAPAILRSLKDRLTTLGFLPFAFSNFSLS
jgi:hypothetical protein